MALVVPMLRIGDRFVVGDSLTNTILRELVWWGLAGALLALVLLGEKRTLASIGIRTPTWKTWVFGVLAAVAMMVSVLLVYGVIFPLLGLHMNAAAVERITRNPLWLQGLIFARAAVVEELLYRGYAIGRIAEIARSPWAAAIVSLVAFVAAHLSGWGAAQLIVVGVSGLLLTLLYLWRRDLICNIVAHFLVDAGGFLLAAASGHA